MKKNHSRCKEPRCRNYKAQGNYCHRCKKARFAKKNPVRYAYMNLRTNSKRRGIEFTLTFDQFKEFCTETDILLGRGRQKDSYSIDRIDNSKGYTKENIQVLTVSENSKKYHK